MKHRVSLACWSGVAAVSLLVAAAGLGQASGVATGTSSVRGNGYIVFASDRSGNFDIWRMDIDGSALLDLTPGPSADLDPAWSPDGKQIAFVSDRDGNDEIFTMRADGSGLRQVTTTAGSVQNTQPAWSPDGTRIAFTSTRDGNQEVYVQHASGSGAPIDLTKNPADDSDPAWSPDGNQIAFTSTRDGNQEVYVTTANGSGQSVDLTQDPGADSQPAWSPDGAEIAFTSDRTGNNDIFVMTPAGLGQTDLTNTAASETEPVFSPDGGTRVAFTTDRDGNDEIYYLQPIQPSFQFDLTVNPATDGSPSWQPLPPRPIAGTPIKHIVVLYQENQSFNSVLGPLCVALGRCEGTLTGTISTGGTIDLNPAPDIVPGAGHSQTAQTTAMDGGKMDAFDLIRGCGAATHYACYQAYQPEQIPNIAALAQNFAIADRSFEGAVVSSWGAHFVLASSQMDGFYLDQHINTPHLSGPGWGCDSKRQGGWSPSIYGISTAVDMPTCVPERDGSGPYRPSQAAWVPTIMDRLDQAGLSWKIYSPPVVDPGYIWAICPTFADCFYTQQRANMTDPGQFVTDVTNGDLPTLSLVVPLYSDSQHNGKSMRQGDNWIAQQVSAIMNSPDWSSTAIFLTWDDCGCFYDPVAPPAGDGIREPMIIISPFVKPSSTDSHDASVNSILAFTEHTLGLAPLGSLDGNAYDFSGSFDYSQPPLSGIRLSSHPLPKWEVAWLRTHPAPQDHDPS